jgi:ketosteroid isomerase-like protein
MRSGTATRCIPGGAAARLLPVRLCALFVLVLIMASSAPAGVLDIRLEGGGVWFSRNDVRIPGDDGTKFDMLDLTGKGPDPYYRLYAAYDFNDKHALRLTLAPLEVEGTGMLSEDVVFKGEVFTADTIAKGKYRFNTYRLTYRWTFHDRERWRWGLGGAVLVRDAEITLEQGDRRQSEDDLGLVPLLHLYGEYRLNDKASLVLDVEGAWSPMGRAVDMALMARHDFDSGWYAAAGYRTLEGGVDNDTVYAFAWLHYAQAAVGYRF